MKQVITRVVEGHPVSVMHHGNGGRLAELKVQRVVAQSDKELGNFCIINVEVAVSVGDCWSLVRDGAPAATCTVEKATKGKNSIVTLRWDVPADLIIDRNARLPRLGEASDSQPGRGPSPRTA